MRRRFVDAIIMLGPVTSTVVIVGVFTSIVALFFEGLASREPLKILSGFLSLAGICAYVPVAKKVETTWREAEKQSSSDIGPEDAVKQILTLSSQEKDLQRAGTYASVACALLVLSFVTLCWGYIFR